MIVPPKVDRIWLRVYHSKIPLYPIFYLLKGGSRGPGVMLAFPVREVEIVSWTGLYIEYCLRLDHNIYYSSFHFLFHYPNVNLISSQYNPHITRYSSFHFLFHSKKADAHQGLGALSQANMENQNLSPRVDTKNPA